MPIVEVTERLLTPIARVWKLIRDVESYPQLMKPVRSVTILQRDGLTLVSRWEVELKGSLLQWSEREVQDPERHRVEYKQIDGDLELFEGYWQLEAISPEITEAKLYVSFEIGIPMLREMLNPVAARAIAENSRAMLLSLGPKAE
jgi:ribosome-associated toxin RatA of RatAB toxin-antitoxin module